jgi:hypothetical protein
MSQQDIRNKENVIARSPDYIGATKQSQKARLPRLRLAMTVGSVFKFKFLNFAF